MSEVLQRGSRPSTHRSDTEVVGSPPAWFGAGSLVLGGLLVLNTLLGPLVADVITYPFSGTVVNETLGLEAVTLLLVAPLCVGAGVLALRGRRVGAVLALGPTGYTVYMFVQYVAGPGYLTYAPSLLLHVTIFALAATLLLRAWTLSAPAVLPVMTSSSERRWSVVLWVMAAFVLSRWLEALINMTENAPLDEAYLSDAGMYWSIFLLDLGVVLPALVVAAVALWRGRQWARTALFALVGWFALVPPSVTAMAITKLVNDDPYANQPDTVVLAVATVVFAIVAVLLYRTLFRGERSSAV